MKEQNKKAITCIVVCLALLLVFLCGCDAPAQNSETPASNNSSSSTSNSNEISIDESAMVDGFECRIKEINWYSASDFDYDVIQKEDGYEYIVIVLSEKNTNSNTENAPMLSLLSADGVECLNQSALSLYKKQYKINFGATMADTTAEAYVIYKIPAGAESFKLQILSNGFGESSKYFVFTRDDIK